MIHERIGVNGPRYEVRAKRPNSKKLLHVGTYDTPEEAQAELDKLTEQFLKEWLMKIDRPKNLEPSKGRYKYQALYQFMVATYGAGLTEVSYEQLTADYNKTGLNLKVNSVIAYVHILRQKGFIHTAKINNRLFVYLNSRYIEVRCEIWDFDKRQKKVVYPVVRTCGDRYKDAQRFKDVYYKLCVSRWKRQQFTGNTSGLTELMRERYDMLINHFGNGFFKVDSINDLAPIIGVTNQNIKFVLQILNKSGAIQSRYMQANSVRGYYIKL